MNWLLRLSLVIHVAGAMSFVDLSLLPDISTDRLSRTGEGVTVTKDLLGGAQPASSPEEFNPPEEVPPGGAFSEGGVSQVEVNRYERDPQARRACIAPTEPPGECGFRFEMMSSPEADG